MAMELQSKNCHPGYSLMRDLNEDPNNTWPSYYVEKKVNDNPYDNLMQRPVNGYLAYDKEILKRTMLEHEAIFRKQVYELHRLYRIQKDMMYELQTSGGLHRSPMPEETSQSNSFSSQIRSENSQMVWQSHFPIVKNCYDNMPSVGTYDMKPPVNFMKEGSVQSGLVPIKNSSSLKEIEFVDYKVESQSRRMLDLGVPAGASFDLNYEGTSEKKDAVESSAYKAVPFCTGNPESTVKQMLGNSEGNRSRKGECLFGLGVRNGMMTENPSASNRLTTIASGTGPEESPSVQYLGTRYHWERNLDHHLVMRSRENGESGLINKLHASDFGNHNGKTNGRFPIFTSDDSGRRGKGLDVFSESRYGERFSVPSGPLQLYHNRSQENHSLYYNKEAWFKQKPVNFMETSAGGSHIKISNNAGSGFPSMPTAFPEPQKNFTSISSSFVSSGTKSLNGMSDLPISTRELPCLNTSFSVSKQSAISNAAPQNSVAISETQQNNDNLPSGQRNNANDPYCNTGLYHSFDLNSSDAEPLFISKKLKCKDDANSSSNGNVVDHQNKSVKDFQCRSLPALREINLNFAPSTTDEDLTDQDGLLAEKKTKDLSEDPSWLKKGGCSKQFLDLNSLASDMEPSFLDDHNELPSTNFSTSKTSKENYNLSVHGSNDHLQVIDQKTQLNEASECTDRRPCGFLLLEKTRQSSLVPPSVPQVEKSLTNILKRNEKDAFLFNKLNFEQSISCLEVLSTERSEEKVVKDCRNIINLNIELTGGNEEALPNSVVEFQASSSSQIGAGKACSQIDLESPVCHFDGSIRSHHVSMESSEKKSSHEKEGSIDMLARLAAENIVAISTQQISHRDKVDYSCSSPCDSLRFFVDIALSVSEETITPSRRKDGNRLSDDEGLDLFEAMTLALKEVKVHDLCSKPNLPLNIGETEEEDIGAAAQLFTRRRRGQARRRRQRKDFQKDVLPGLSSLSRHEVSEDLQLIGDLMKASGKSWQSGLGKRNSGRNGANSRGKGKRQLTNCSATAADNCVDPQPPVQANNNEPEVVATSMIGWGRTTRRCRRQKTLPGNVVSSWA